MPPPPPAMSGAAQVRAARMECRICWRVYDPAEGDAHWQIPRGTPFGALPDHWTCPACSATKDQFLVLRDDG